MTFLFRFSVHMKIIKTCFTNKSLMGFAGFGPCFFLGNINQTIVWQFLLQMNTVLFSSQLTLMLKSCDLTLWGESEYLLKGSVIFTSSLFTYSGKPHIERAVFSAYPA